MEADGTECAENGGKLRRGRISLERKREILEQYDLLSKPCSKTDAAAILGVRQAALSKILSERDEIKETVNVKIDSVGAVNVDDDGAKKSPKLKRGRLSYERQKELLALYDQLPVSLGRSEAACKLGVKEVTLAKLLANRRTINSRGRKRKNVKADSTSDSDDSQMLRSVPGALGLRRGLISHERQRELLEQYDKLKRPVSHPVAAAELGISETTLTDLLSSRDATSRLSQPGGSGARRDRRSPQPGSSGLNMALRQGGRHVRVDYSEDEQSSSDYKASDSDSTDGDAEGSKDEDEVWRKKQTKKRYSLEEREKMLAKYDELSCPQNRAAKILGITQSTLSNWLSQRPRTNSDPKHSKRRKIKLEEEEEDSVISGEEIDSYVMGSTNGTKLIQFFEVSAEEQDRKSNDSCGNSNTSRKPHMTLREKFEIYKKYDSMDPDSQKQAADTFNLNKSTWFNLMANRFYYEKRFKTVLCKDMDVLNKYDELENKRSASKVLNVPQPKLKKILENRAVIEKYFTELFGSNDVESAAISIKEAEPPRKESKALKTLEKELLHWFKEAENDHMNWEDLKEKAKELAAKSGMDDFDPSDAWLRKWNKTNVVLWNKRGKLVPVYGFGENRSVSECVLMALKDYPPENVFNLVETGLYFRAVPGCPPITDDWLTVVFACNMSGTGKKKPLVVGKSQAPLCFRVVHLPLEYKYSSSACMTEEIVSSFLHDWNEELAESNRSIALILDSSPSHPNVHLSQIRLFFVPTDCSGVQPLNDGIVGHVKALYRTRMAESLQNLGTKRKRSTAENITIVDTLFALSEAWENVPKSLLVSKFLKSTFPQTDSGEPEKDDLDDEELQGLNELDEEIQLHSGGSTGLKVGDKVLSELEGGHVVHVEGTLKLSDEEEGDFDIDSLLQDQDTHSDPNTNSGQNATSDLGSQLKNFLQNTPKPNGSVTAGPPTASEVRGALATIKRFLQVTGCTLEDLTDYTQLETKVLSKMKNMSAAFKLSSPDPTE